MQKAIEAIFSKTRQMGRTEGVLLSWLGGNPFPTTYEGEGEGGGTGGGDGGGAGGGSGGGGGDDDLPPELKGKASFTQDELNTILKKDRLKHKTQIDKERGDKEKAIKNLEALQKSKGLGDQEKAALASQIEDLRNSMLTKEQLAAQNEKKLREKHETDVKTLSGERDLWHGRFQRSTINTAIIGAAVSAEAFDADDIINVLAPNTKLVQEVDPETNEATEHFVPKVKFRDTDKDGKPVVLDFTVEQAVARMKELPKFKHLFKTPAAGGVGGNNGGGKGKGGKDPSKMTPEEWKAHRKTLGLGRKPNGQT